MPRLKDPTGHFISQAKVAHGGKYDYSPTEYKGKGTKVKFICPEHGIQEQNPRQHILHGCPACTGVGLRYDAASFITAARAVHGDKYDYSQVVYANSHTPVRIYCPVHKEVFEQRPHAHLNLRQGCPACGLENRSYPGRKTTERFVEQARAKWGDRYDYSETVYVNKSTKVKFFCVNNNHGHVLQVPALHLKHGCQYCNGRGANRHRRDSFVAIANKVHEGRYDYSKTVFARMTDYVTITCPRGGHGDFVQNASNHVNLGNGCPKCDYSISRSRAEDDIVKLIRSVYDGPVVENDRKELAGQGIDIFLPEIRVGIEYHGVYWHLETVRPYFYHYRKWKAASERNIRLLQVYSTEWEGRRKILESKILNLFGRSERIMGRKTKVVPLSREQKDEFLSRNHLQGEDNSKTWLGLEYGGEVVACMTFGPSRFNRAYDHEMVRFCNKVGCTVVGGAGKLLARFREGREGSIVTYADKRYSAGNLYRQLGFTLDGHSRPSFSYFNIRNNQLYNRMRFQKKSLKNMPGYSDDLSEYEIMQKNGYDRIWDAGHYRFVMR